MQLDALVQAGKTEVYGEQHFLPLLTRASGTRYGVVQSLAWAMVDGSELVVFAPATAKHFIELLEHPRREIDAELERAVAAVGLPVELAWSFPAVELVRAMIASGSPHFTRVALAWLLPTELRELRAEIQRVADDSRMLAAVREFARRLVVPQ